MAMSGRSVCLSLLIASALVACGDDSSSGATSGGGDTTSATGGPASSSSSGSPTTTSSASAGGDGGDGTQASSTSGSTSSGSTSDGGGGNTNQGGGGNTSDGGGGNTNQGGGGNTSDGGGGNTSDGGGGSTNQGGGGSSGDTTSTASSVASSSASSSSGGDPCAGDCFDVGCIPGKECGVGNDGCGVCECEDAIVDIDPLTSLYIRDPAVLARPEFEFSAVLQAIIDSAGATANQDPRDLYIRWFDTNNDDASAVVAGGLHCDDEINGFPIDCPRQEGELARRADEEIGTPSDPLSEDHYKLVAIVHRFDKVPVDGANCGQYRFSYSLKDAAPPADPADPDFNYLIFEGVLPNPRTDLGIAGCLPVAQYIVSLNEAATADQRAALIQDFFFNGLPDFDPILDWRSFRGEPSGAGQLRTNQFILSVGNQAWAAREYYLARIGDSPANYELVVTPETVKENAYGRLFNEDFVDARKGDFEDWFVDEAVAVLAAATNVNDIIFAVPNEFNAGQSTQPGLTPEDFTEEDLVGDYVAQASGNTAFLDRIQSRLTQLGSPLTPLQVIARAEQQTCAGCHQLVSFSTDLGGGLNYFGTGILGFVHTLEDLDDDGGYTMSDALTEQFFPRRVATFESYVLNECASDVSSQTPPVALPLLRGMKRSIGGGIARGH